MNIAPQTAVLFLAAASGLLLWGAGGKRLCKAKELGRFSDEPKERQEPFGIGKFFSPLLQRSLGTRIPTRDTLLDRRMVERLKSCDFIPAKSGSLPLLAAAGAFALWIIILILALDLLSYYFWALVLAGSALATLLSQFWRRLFLQQQDAEVRAELALFVELLSAAIDSGWGVRAAVERVVERMRQHLPEGPLVTELSGACWLAANGFTWEESFGRISRMFRSAPVSEVMRALVWAVNDGSDWRGEIARLAHVLSQDCQGSFAGKLAAIPQMALMYAAVVFTLCGAVLFSPATQIFLR